MIRAGTKLSFYEVLAPLGAGAMGEVWRARDTKLDREVALKVLPEHFADDPERLRRFEREAKALASLNHPNVAQIYGVDQVGDTCFLALELVPGETLEDRLKRGPLPVGEAIEVTSQIAEGLEAAHDAGVIHRDLKPANVRLTPDGKVKVLDFGLAKPSREPGGSGSSTDSVLSTEAGRLLGTPTYMAPEQARGKAIDKRVDVWAFGCVLFECLTAKRAFQGETLPDVLASVLEGEPDWSALPRNTPPAVRAVLARCLAKDPRQRLRDVGDARLELTRPAAADGIPSRQVGPGLLLLRALPWAATLLLAALWLRSAQRVAPPPASPRPRHLSVRLPHGVELAGFGDVDQNQILAISPDGTRLAFAAEEDGHRRLFLRALDSPEVLAVPGSEDAQCPFFSPDGKWIAFGARGKLWKTPMGVGQPIEVAALFPDRGGAWGRDGSIVLAPTKTSGLLRIPPGGGAPVVLTRPDEAQGERSHRWPAFLPGGDEIAFTVGTVDRPGDYDDAVIDAVSISTGKRRTILRGASFVRVLEPGTLVIGRNGQLFTLPAEEARGDPLGSALPVVEGISGIPASGVVFFDLTADGTLAYAERDPRESEFELAWVARDGTVEPLGLPTKEYRTPRISPDGKTIAVSIGPGGGRASDVWLVDIARKTFSRLTFDHRSYSPTWSHDGERVAFVTDRGGKGVFAWKRADGNGEPETLAEFPSVLPRFPLGFTAEGDGLLFLTQGKSGTAQDVFEWSLKEQRAIGVLEGPAGEHYATLSPDGKWLAYVSDESGAREVYVQDFPGKRGRWQIGEGWMAPRWGRDGRALYVLKGKKILEVPVEVAPTFSSGEERLVAEPDFLPYEESVANYDVGADGRLLVVRPTSRGSYRGHLEVVVDWGGALRARGARAGE